MSARDEARGWQEVANRAMEQYANGHDEAFDALYDLLAPRLYTFLARKTRDRVRAEDLLQQTFLQMHAARRHFTPGSPVLPWAFAIGRRLLIDSFRHGRRERPHDDPNREEESPLLPTPDKVDSVVARRRLMRQVEEGLALVPEAHRTAFELVRYDGLSMSEAAQVLGTTVSTVKSRAFRTYAFLRERLGDAVREELGEVK